MSTTILAIESSCDETSASVVSDGKVLSNIIATQTVHERYGGVVPELASRAHQQHIVPVVEDAMKSANIDKSQLDAIAFTRGPGLLGALLVGVSFAKSMALGLNIPLIEVNHMEAHVLAHFINQPHPNFPFLCLTVSGGHTQIVKVSSHLEMKVLGQTLDDAVGEAFDKSAKLLGLPYPGGPLIDKYAALGDHLTYKFPDSSIPQLNFSFSGIKTAFMYFLKENIAKNPYFIEQNIENICASLQFSLTRMLMQKLKRASDQTKIKQIAIAGGVAANRGLRNTLSQLAIKKKWDIFIPEMQYCTDNAAMIAIAAYYKYKAGIFTNQQVTPLPRMNIAPIQ